MNITWKITSLDSNKLKIKYDFENKSQMDAIFQRAKAKSPIPQGRNRKNRQRDRPHGLRVVWANGGGDWGCGGGS